MKTLLEQFDEYVEDATSIYTTDNDQAFDMLDPLRERIKQTAEPLIWTSKGNLPISSLTYETAWDDQPTYIKFVERYRDASGEVVKESAHAYSKIGLLAEGVAANIGE